MMNRLEPMSDSHCGAAFYIVDDSRPSRFGWHLVVMRAGRTGGRFLPAMGAIKAFEGLWLHGWEWQISAALLCCEH